MATVVFAHEGRDFSAPEQEILKGIGADVIYERNLDALMADGRAAQVDALMVGTERVTADLIAQMPNCRIVSRVGTGLDAIDIPAATARGIWVTNVPDYSVDEVSTHAITLLLALARRLPRVLE